MKSPCGILLGTLFVFGQQPPLRNPEQSGVVFRVTSALVQVDAVVTDSKGRNISDLTPNDFKVMVDGTPQQLTNFSYISVSSEARATALTQVAKGTPLLPPPPSAQLRPEDVRRTIVLLVDDLGLSFESMAFVRTSLRKFVENQIQPGDLVAVMRTGAGSGSLQQFTADKRVLLSAIDGLRWNPRGRSGIDVFEQLGKLSDEAQRLSNIPKGAEQSLDVSHETRSKTISTVGTLGAINYIVDALRQMPGRKSIALFSDGMHLFTPGIGPLIHTDAAPPDNQDNAEVIEAMRKLIDRANRSGTVIYTMQATGLRTGQLDAADRVKGQPSVLHQLTQIGQVGGRDWILNINQQGLAYLADKTGGLAYQNGNDLNWGLGRMLEDQKGYYLLGFRPPEGTFQEKQGVRSFHSLLVKVERTGLRVRSKSGFFGETDEEAAGQRPRTPVEQMRTAMLSPFKSSDVALRLTALYAEKPKGGAVVRNLLHIDARDLTWKPAPDGTVTADVQVVAVATGGGDVPLDTVALNRTLKVQSGKLAEALREGLVYTLDVPVAKRGAYQIRVAVRDEVSGKVGSASQFIEIPDLKKARFVLASIVLQDGAVSSASPDFPIAPARRQFRQGDEMEYLCAVQKGGDSHATTGLATQIQIIREGQEVYAAAAKVVEVPQSGPAIFGRLRLTGKMAPGQYYLHVIATDRRGGKDMVADQWADFELLP